MILTKHTCAIFLCALSLASQSSLAKTPPTPEPKESALPAFLNLDDDTIAVDLLKVPQAKHAETIQNYINQLNVDVDKIKLEFRLASNSIAVLKTRYADVFQVNFAATATDEIEKTYWTRKTNLFDIIHEFVRENFVAAPAKQEVEQPLEAPLKAKQKGNFFKKGLLYASGLLGIVIAALLIKHVVTKSSTT